MDYLWTPWRYAYVTGSDAKQRQGVPEELSAWPGDSGCVFCNIIAAVDYAEAHGLTREHAERAALIVLRTKRNYICLNRFPYTSGHLMVVPLEHQSSLTALPTETLHEMMDLTERTERVLAAVYQPDGFNFGLNLGKAAGAGVAGHLHLHGLPRWVGDTNFMTVVGETRILPEDLSVTWERLRSAFAAEAAKGPRR
ncbi:MAG TPA: HIT domain-containing protein [Acidobacteriaceae bacterium]|nr:HIT domain-containing protein [Acidobacteriaceae bacterium]